MAFWPSGVLTPPDAESELESSPPHPTNSAKAQVTVDMLVRNLFGFVRRDVDGGLVRITVTGTIGSTSHREDYAELGRVIGGLRVTPGAGTTPLLDEEVAQ